MIIQTYCLYSGKNVFVLSIYVLLQLTQGCYDAAIPNICSLQKVSCTCCSTGLWGISSTGLPLVLFSDALLLAIFSFLLPECYHPLLIFYLLFFLFYLQHWLFCRYFLKLCFICFLFCSSTTSLVAFPLTPLFPWHFILHLQSHRPPYKLSMVETGNTPKTLI